MPHTTPQAAGSGQTPPALIPLPPDGSPMPFWAVEAMNRDAKAIAIEILYDRVLTAEDHTTRMALIAAYLMFREKTTEAVKDAKREGHLLYCWRGSRALVDNLLDADIDAAAKAAGVVVL